MEYYKNLSLEDIVYINGNGIECIEQWKSVVGYEGSYMVSDLGRVKSVERYVNGRIGKRINKSRILKQNFGAGYLYFSLYTEGKSQHINRTIHILVAIAFLNHIQKKYITTVDHKNNIKTDNRAVNLQIITQRENTSKDRITKSGFIGVHSNSSGYYASLLLNRKYVNLGQFSTAKEAHIVRCKAVKLIDQGKSIDFMIKKRSNKCNIAGVHKRDNKFRAIITINKKTKILGIFKTAEEAGEVYREAKININKTKL